MNSNPIFQLILRFLLLLGFQVLVMKQFSQVTLGPFVLEGFIYPLYVLLLPIRFTPEVLLLIGFGTGLSVDVFYGSYGLHAAATVLLAFLRPLVLRQYEPRGGFPPNSSPTVAKLKSGPFYQYTAILLGIHLLVYYLLMEFNLASILLSLAKTVLAFLVSMFFIYIFMSIINPRD